MSLLDKIEKNNAHEINPKLTEQQKQFYLGRLVKCGDILGDGDLDPEFERQVRKEYRQTLDMLYPNIAKAERQARAEHRDILVSKWLELDRQCPECKAKGRFTQSRKGAMKVQCNHCKSKFSLSARK